MKLDSARDLKLDLLSKHVAPLMTAGDARGAIAFSAGPKEKASQIRRTIAIGIVRGGRNNYRLAIRVQRLELMGSPKLESLVRQAKREVDVRYVGRVYKRATPWTFKNQRPLQIGTSIGHFAITAGTLGCFVRRRSNGEILMLSNNHVLANENDASKGDAILQRGHLDGGRLRTDTVGKLSDFIKLKATGRNVLDCAVAKINASIGHKVNTLKGIGKLKGQGPGFLDKGVKVSKVGRTTGVTRGQVTAFEIDNLVIEYGMGDIVFDDSIEIESTEPKPFCLGGDSGSLIVDSDNMGVGLLYGGGDVGGLNGMGLTWANPIQRVLDALKVDLAF